jgi:hypothetical protein
MVRREGGFGAFVVVQEWEQGCVPPHGRRPVRGDPGVEAGEGVVAETGGFAELGVGEALALTVEDKFGVVDEGHAVRGGELLGTVADEVDMVALFENQAGGLYGIAKALDASHSTGLHAAAVHEKSIELDAAIGGEKAAAAGVEGGVVFEDGDGGFDGIESGCSAREESIAGFKSLADTVQVVSSGVGGDGPCATVHEESGGVRSRGGHRAMVVHLGGGLQRRVVAGQREKISG